MQPIPRLAALGGWSYHYKVGRYMHMLQVRPKLASEINFASHPPNLSGPCDLERNIPICTTETQIFMSMLIPKIRLQARPRNFILSQTRNMSG
jgi:hypothetical protein